MHARSVNWRGPDPHWSTLTPTPPGSPPPSGSGSDGFPSPGTSAEGITRISGSPKSASSLCLSGLLPILVWFPSDRTPVSSHSHLCISPPLILILHLSPYQLLPAFLLPSQTRGLPSHPRPQGCPTDMARGDLCSLNLLPKSGAASKCLFDNSAWPTHLSSLAPCWKHPPQVTRANSSHFKSLSQ